MAELSDFPGKSLVIHSASGPYHVHIRTHSFLEFLRARPTATILADAFFAPLFTQAGIPATFIAATEENKALTAIPAIIEALRKSGANRKTELIAVGGGVLQDISAFIASIYMRGLTWTYVPTTILAMVDSCIGGKSSINVGPYKNLVGTFHPPTQVLIDPSLTETLPAEQQASGLIEAAKICFCRSPEAFSHYLSLNPSVDMPAPALESLIHLSLASKKWLIEIDEFDQKERLTLNFGHTFGHAVEGATHFAIPHGIAVGVGILCALEFERASGKNYADCKQVTLLERHLTRMISTLPGIADRLQAMPLDDFFERFQSDKKHGPDDYTLILVDPSGQVALRQLPRTPATVTAVQAAVQSIAEGFQD